MRLILRLEASKEQVYDNNYNHHVQSFFYNLIRNTEFNHIHDSKIMNANKQMFTPFCFSNIFPYGNMKKEDVRNIVISSPNEKLILFIYNKIRRIRAPIHLGAMHFHIINSKFFRTNISYPLVIASVTPIIMRIPQHVYQNYSLNLKYPYEYVFWRQAYPLELFLDQLETNLKRKFVNYYGCQLESTLSFPKFVFERQVSRKLIIRGMTQTIIATYWKFWFEEDNEIIRFAFDAGFGERNRLGFGFMDTTQ
jgi:CRISPR-associated endoribonuclease Cas6